MGYCSNGNGHPGLPRNGVPGKEPGSDPAVGQQLVGKWIRWDTRPGQLILEVTRPHNCKFTPDQVRDAVNASRFLFDVANELPVAVRQDEHVQVQKGDGIWMITIPVDQSAMEQYRQRELTWQVDGQQETRVIHAASSLADQQPAANQ